MYDYCSLFSSLPKSVFCRVLFFWPHHTEIVPIPWCWHSLPLLFSFHFPFNDLSSKGGPHVQHGQSIKAFQRAILWCWDLAKWNEASFFSFQLMMFRPYTPPKSSLCYQNSIFRLLVGLVSSFLFHIAVQCVSDNLTNFNLKQVVMFLWVKKVHTIYHSPFFIHYLILALYVTGAVGSAFSWSKDTSICKF